MKKLYFLIVVCNGIALQAFMPFAPYGPSKLPNCDSYVSKKESNACPPVVDKKSTVDEVSVFTQVAEKVASLFHCCTLSDQDLKKNN
jgi:hypothetical protein